MIVVQYILPALRTAIAKELIEKYGFRNTEVAEKMNVTPAAVTQYLNKSRGETAFTTIESSSRVMGLVSEITRDLAEGESPADLLLLKLCRICQAVRAEGLICDLHREEMPSLRQVSCACSLGLVGWGGERQK
jgi:hypothetical protein